MNEKCQVFTPSNYVEELLNSVGYVKNLYGKKILENSCGDGNILTVVVQRYIDDGRRHGLSDTEIRKGLENDVYGIEIDPEQYRKCIDNLNRISNEKGLVQINWNIINCNYLEWRTEIKFCYVVGNPPYITYKELDDIERKYVKENFITCGKGKFDYCYAFIEKSIDSLENIGKMAYLIPSSIFKTVFGEKLRQYMQPYITEIKDYTQEKLFDNALVKSSIMILDRNRKGKELHYIDMMQGTNINISMDSMGKKWFFTNDLGGGSHRFGDYYRVSHVVATLLNEAFVLKQEDCIETEEFIQCRNHNIEKEIVRQTATPRSLRYNKVERIIFPYSYTEEGIARFEEKEFMRKFPGATAYLQEFKKKLDRRKKDKNAKWFEYGRSQALVGLNREKLLISTIITENVVVNRIFKECIPYAGMYIVARESGSEYTLDKAVEILESREFMQYILDVGIHISGSSLRITSKDIENYRF